MLDHQDIISKMQAKNDGDYDGLLLMYIELMAQADAAKELASKYAERSKAFQSAADDCRKAIAGNMAMNGESKYSSAIATVSQKSVAPKVILVDEAAIPEQFRRVKIEYDERAIGDAIKSGESVAGACLSNGGQTISIRLK